MAISTTALAAIAAKMRGNCNSGITSTTNETASALETYREDVKTAEKNQKKEMKRKKNTVAAKKAEVKKTKKKETTEKKKNEKKERKCSEKNGSKKKKKPSKEKNELGRKSHRMNLVTVTADHHQNRHRLVRVVTVGRTNRVNRINVYYCVIWLLYMPIV